MPSEPMMDLSPVQKFINSELLYREDQAIDHSMNLIENGVIDSMTLLRLVSFLETQYGIEIPDEDIVPDNFRSLESIQAFLGVHVNGSKGKRA
jgi:acyl carrier protein